jgi:hypothetical protein
MTPITLAALTCTALFVGLLAFLEVGHRVGLRDEARNPGRRREGAGAVEGSVFGLLGLLLAFSFGGAAGRFQERNRLVVQEANNIGTAWLRIDLLPAPEQPAMRALFRRYLDSRLATYARLPDLEAALAELRTTTAIQGEIWTLAVAQTAADQNPNVARLLLPSLNEMFDIVTTRTRAGFVHTQPVIQAYLMIVALLGALLAGYSLSSVTRRLWYFVLYALMTAGTLYVIIDFDHPRMGLIRVDRADQVLKDLRATMN